MLKMALKSQCQITDGRRPCNNKKYSLFMHASIKIINVDYNLQPILADYSYGVKNSIFNKNLD